MSDLVEVVTSQEGPDDRARVIAGALGRKLLAPIEAGGKGNTDFDPIAVGDKIAEHVAAADRAQEKLVDHKKAAGDLLLDVLENHPEHLEAICDRIKLGLSRRKELLMIAGGRKTLEQSRAENTARQHRHREKKRTLRATGAKPLQGGVTAESEAERNVDPDATPDAVKAVQTKAEAGPKLFETRESSKPDSGKAKAKRLPSDRALAEFKFAVGQYLPDMNPNDRSKALECVRGFVERLEQPVAQAA